MSDLTIEEFGKAWHDIAGYPLDPETLAKTYSMMHTWPQGHVQTIYLGTNEHIEIAWYDKNGVLKVEIAVIVHRQHRKGH